MRRVVPWMLLACNTPTADPCDGPYRVQLVQAQSYEFHVDFAGGHTFVTLDGEWPDERTQALYVGEACGADAQEIDLGIRMHPVRLHPEDPAADDPTLLCDEYNDHFFRLGDDGALALLLPRFRCNGLLVTPHGPVVLERDTQTWWLAPNFPDEVGAEALGRDYAHGSSAVWVADRLLYVGEDGIRSRDLVSGAEALIVPGAAEFEHTASHLLWRADVGGAVAPMNVHELATGVDRYVGLYHKNDDVGGGYSFGGASWRFDADGAHILHLPIGEGSLMSAYALDGTPVPFVQSGGRLAYPPSGGVIVRDGATIRHAVAGSPDGVILDVPELAVLEDLQVFDDRLEVRVGTDLHAVPLDGGPATMVAQEIFAERVYIDDELLLTLGGYGLEVIHLPSQARGRLDVIVSYFEYHPGRGVYYSRDLGNSPESGVWWIADETIPQALFLDCKRELCW